MIIKIKPVVLLVMIVIFIACACTSVVKDDEIPPYFDFNYDNCVSVLDDSEHVYHTNKFIVTGCNALIEQAVEREVWERSNSEGNEE